MRGSVENVGSAMPARGPGRRQRGTQRAPRVSVIVIFLDEADYLAEAAQSVLAQTFQDFELLLVDDGSTDGSRQIAEALSAEDPARVRYLTHASGQRRGHSATRNLGIAHARGEFIAFLDGDDVWLPEKLAEQVAIFDAEPSVQMVYGRTQIWHQWRNDPENDDFFYDLGMAADRCIPPLEPLRVMLANQAQSPTTCNAIVRRSVVDRVGGFPEHFQGMFEDQVFFAKVMASSPIYVSSRVWARYRQHADSLSAQVDPADDWLARDRYLRWLGRYLRETGVTDRALRADLRGQRWACAKQRLRLRLQLGRLRRLFVGRSLR